MHDVFVSHSSLDKSVADAIVARLESKGIRCWVAPRDVPPGSVWSEEIVRAIGSSRLMVLVLSAEANHSHQVLREVTLAGANNLVMVPFRTEQIEISGAMAYFLASEHWLDAVTPPLESNITRLLGVVQRILNGTSEGDPEFAAGDQEDHAIAPASTPSAPPASAPPASAPPASAPPASRPPASLQPASPPSPPWRLLFIGAAGLAVAAALILVAFVVVSRTGSHGGTPQHAATTLPKVLRQVSYSVLKPGECIVAPKIRSGDVPLDVSVVSCSGRHDAEALFVGDPWKPGQAYPGEKALDQQFTTYCEKAFKTYVGVSTGSSSLSYTGILEASREVWSTGERRMGCFVIDPKGELVGTVKGSRR